MKMACAWRGAVIVLACLIYSAFLSSSSPAVDSSLPATTMAWQYIGQLIFKEALIKSTCADLRQKFLLTRKKIAGILTDFKIF